MHRDIKPENLLISELREDFVNIKLSDFGWCCAHDDPVALTSKCGTVGYMAPEVERARDIGDGSPFLPKHSTKADVFSMGVTLHEILTGMGREPALSLSY